MHLCAVISCVGTKTLSLLTSPLAKGLFHKAIVESGSALITPERVTTLERAEAAGKRISAKLGMDNAENQLAALRAAKWEDIVAAAGDKEVNFPANLVVDGYVLPQSVHDTIKNSKQHDVPLMVGANEGERGELQQNVPMLANLMSSTAKRQIWMAICSVCSMTSRLQSASRMPNKSCSQHLARKRRVRGAAEAQSVIRTGDEAPNVEVI